MVALVATCNLDPVGKACSSWSRNMLETTLLKSPCLLMWTCLILIQQQYGCLYLSGMWSDVDLRKDTEENMYSKKITVHAQNVLPILGSMANTIGQTYMTTWCVARIFAAWRMNERLSCKLRILWGQWLRRRCGFANYLAMIVCFLGLQEVRALRKIVKERTFFFSRGVEQLCFKRLRKSRHITYNINCVEPSGAKSRGWRHFNKKGMLPPSKCRCIHGMWQPKVDGKCVMPTKPPIPILLS